MNDSRPLTPLVLHRRLAELPSELHWLCPRNAAEEMENDEVEMTVQSAEAHDERVSKAKARILLVRRCLMLFSFESSTSLDWFQEHLATQLSRCEECVMEYHQSKRRCLISLAEDYADDEVAQLRSLIDDWDQNRLEPLLKTAMGKLQNTPELQRGVGSLDTAMAYAIFECLASPNLLSRQPLRTFFDRTFELVQTKKSLPTVAYLPACTQFLFEANEVRRLWASKSLQRLQKKRMSPSTEQFEWAIQQQLIDAMTKATAPFVETDVVKQFWTGCSYLIPVLSQQNITHDIRGLDFNIHRITLDHLQYGEEIFPSLLRSITALLEVSASDYWDALGDIRADVLIEQILDNGAIKICLKDASKYGKPDQYFEWLHLVMGSLPLAQRPSACKTITSRLLGTLQREGFSSEVRTACLFYGLQILSQTVESFANKNFSMIGSVDRVAANEAVDVLSQHINTIANISISSPPTELSEIGLEAMQNVLALDCKSLNVDRKTLSEEKPLPHGHSSFSKSVWEAVYEKFGFNRVPLAKSFLRGTTALVALERFNITDDKTELRGMRSRFNNTYALIIEKVSDIFIRLSEFRSSNLEILFADEDCVRPVISALFSPEEKVYEAAMEVVKQLSDEYTRKAALAYLLRSDKFFEPVMKSIMWAVSMIVKGNRLPWVPRVLETCRDVIDVLCDSSDGVLRSTPTEPKPGRARILHRFWRGQWYLLRNIFLETETWSEAKENGTLYTTEWFINFIRDTIQYSESLWDYGVVFQRAIDWHNDVVQSTATMGSGLSEVPASIMPAMIKFTRLRDAYLLDVFARLVGKILRKLGEMQLTVDDASVEFINTVTGPNSSKTNMTRSQKAELLQALHENLGLEDLSRFGPGQSGSLKQSRLDSYATLVDRSQPTSTNASGQVKNSVSKQKVISLEEWSSKAASAIKRPSKLSESPVTISDEEDVAEIKKLYSGITTPISSRPDTKKNAMLLRKQQIEQSRERKKTDEARAFKEKREKEKAEKKARDAKQAAFAKKSIGRTDFSTVGNLGRMHEPAKHIGSLFTDSEESSDDDDNPFKPGGKLSKESAVVTERRETQLKNLKAAQQLPVKKTKVARSAKDMRARLAPDLSSLHRAILGWDFFDEGAYPTGKSREDYIRVSNTFNSPQQYQDTFEPLLLLECWQSFQKAKEESSFKPFDIKISNRMNVDYFVEINTSMTIKDHNELGIGESDILLISTAINPLRDSNVPHCLARVVKVQRKRGVAEVSYRIKPDAAISKTLGPGSTIRAVKVTSLVPLEREYGALRGLQYYDLCMEIILAKPSPILKHRDDYLQPLQKVYQVNMAQSKAVASAIENDGFTLIQGPPGTGKIPFISMPVLIGPRK
jgi:senataxin